MPKNIILLSDGTGNSAAKLFKTNVWRIYQALDIRDPPQGGPLQVVMYDNGVGTETFKPLALLGLAFGIGLAQNIKDLYTFLCRNYAPDDSIYLFGFSRGAFTIRILAGVVLRCGLVTWSSESELQERVKLAYAEYKRDVARRATTTRPWLIAGRILGGWQEGAGTDHIAFNFVQHFPGIRFMGVWDTVDAYGMPIDELKEGIDRYVWPMTLADRNLSDHIDRVCHALSLDEERPTFRPVLWTDPVVNRNRLSQVWFAGVHANIGGGYPDDGLSYVTLQWIMSEARQYGLRFYQDHWDECQDRADVQGEQYDSRSGLAGYYRYGPRNVDSLCHDPDHGVFVQSPKVHESAMMRIRRRQVAYAPISFPSLPRGYELLGTGPLGLVPVVPVETPDLLAARAKDLDPVRNAVFTRSVAYVFTVALTVVLVGLPVFDWITSRNFWRTGSVKLEASVPILHSIMIAPLVALSWLSDALSQIPGWHWATQNIGALLQWIVDQQFVPGWLSFWLRSFAVHPALFIFCAAIVLWLFFRKSELLEERIFARSEYSWKHIRG